MSTISILVGCVLLAFGPGVARQVKIHPNDVLIVLDIITGFAFFCIAGGLQSAIFSSKKS